MVADHYKYIVASPGDWSVFMAQIFSRNCRTVGRLLALSLPALDPQLQYLLLLEKMNWGGTVFTTEAFCVKMRLMLKQSEANESTLEAVLSASEIIPLFVKKHEESHCPSGHLGHWQLSFIETWPLFVFVQA